MKSERRNGGWIVCQIGAREHYTIPRALYKAGHLELLITDIWQRPEGMSGRMFSQGAMFQRWHPELASARVRAPNSVSLAFEAFTRVLRGGKSWNLFLRRNSVFQRQCLRLLEELDPVPPDRQRTLFSFSYAAAELFKYAKARGWTTVLGQIDPGPYEEMLVAGEHASYVGTGSTWQPAPPAYWQKWREEISLSDHIIVNSDWARHGLIEQGVPIDKIKIIPLVYDPEDNYRTGHKLPEKAGKNMSAANAPNDNRKLKILFLGNVCLRKGIARLIEAMRILRDEPVELTICGPLSVSPSLWADLPSVQWVRAVENSSIRSSYESADVLILPTVSDGFARTQLESLAAGTPVIASRNCGSVVIDGVNGFVLDRNTPEEIAGLLRRLANDRSLLSNCNTQALPEGSPRTLDELAERLLAISQETSPVAT